MADSKTVINNNWEYDTKCRRCGKIQKWYYGFKDQINKTAFYQAMGIMIANPGTYSCNKCNKSTVQDIVSYN